MTIEGQALQSDAFCHFFVAIVFSPLIASLATFALKTPSYVFLILPPLPVVLISYNPPIRNVQFLGTISLFLYGIIYIWYHIYL